MSATLVEYPARIKSYQVTIARDRADIHLEGVEQGGSKPQTVGHMTFGDPDPIGKDEDFTTRGGFLQMDRPLEMLAGVLELLRHEKDLILQEDGRLSTSD